MGKIVSLADYKRERGIAPPRSPYFTLNATRGEIQRAIDCAAKYLSAPMNFSGKPPYAVVFGYEDKKGRVKLLKSLCCYPSKAMFECDAGRKSLRVLALVRKSEP